MFTTVLLPDSGNAEIDRLDVIKDYKKSDKFSVICLENSLLSRFDGGRKSGIFFRECFQYTIAENYDLIKDIYQQIEPFKTRRAGKLSGGNEKISTFFAP